MSRQRSILALLVIFVVAGCGAQTPSTAPSLALAAVSPSPSALPSESASPSPSPSPSPTPTAIPTATPVPTPSPSPTPVPTPVPWKSYTSKRYHYKMKYPPTWIVTPGSAKLADSYDDFGLPAVYVYRDTVSGIASVSLTVRHDIAYYKSHFKAKVVSNKSIKVGGWSGRMIIFSGTDNGRKLLFQHIILARGKVGFFIDMTGDLENATPDKALFKKIYATWRPT